MILNKGNHVGYLINPADYVYVAYPVSCLTKQSQIFTSILFKWHHEIDVLDVRKPHS